MPEYSEATCICDSWGRSHSRKFKRGLITTAQRFNSCKKRKDKITAMFHILSAQHNLTDETQTHNLRSAMRRFTA
ncbi:MAG: hypothetical protein II877_06090 [Synergistaceae bacterium]|nr:hypothetical protein [Synergistaceae bacterium]